MENEGSALAKKACHRCGVNRMALQTEIRKLRERLEYSELQNLKLSSECRRLGKELREATFRGRSTISPHNVYTLPNEIMDRIFRFVVHLSDLVSPFWKGYERHIPWEISLRARRSIPLVCRRWYHIGLEYLYEHIVLSRTSQIDALAALFQLWKEGTVNAGRIMWVRGIEFLMHTVNGTQVQEVSERACQLIGHIPEGRLKAFGLEHGVCKEPYYQQHTERVVTAAFKISRNCLENLHLPCTLHEEGGSGDIGAAGGGSSTYAGLSRLRRLSLTNGWWEHCRGAERLKHPVIRTLTGNAIFLRAVSINLDIRNENTDVLLRFLSTVVQLDSMTIIVGPYTKLLREDLDSFFDVVPNLRRLLIGPSGRRNYAVPKLYAGDLLHANLEEITLFMDFALNLYALPILEPLFNKIFSGTFSALERIIVRGNFPGGCIDGKQVFPENHFEDWKRLIEGCAAMAVNLVNSEGDRIYLWDEEHGLKPESVITGDGSDSIRSLEGRWWELEGSEGEEYTQTSVGNPVSDDSEDLPYCYVPQRDLDYVTDSDFPELEGAESVRNDSDGTGSEESESEENDSEGTGSEHIWGNLYR